MATKYYGIKDNWTDDDVANVIEVASEDGSVSSVKVNGVEYGGGGGASPVNYLAITIINNSANAVYFASDLVDSLYASLLFVINGLLFAEGETFEDPQITSGNSATINLAYLSGADHEVALNKGNFTMASSNAVNCSYVDDESFPEIHITDQLELSSITITIS